MGDLRRRGKFRGPGNPEVQSLYPTTTGRKDGSEVRTHYRVESFPEEPRDTPTPDVSVPLVPWTPGLRNTSVVSDTLRCSGV